MKTAQKKPETMDIQIIGENNLIDYVPLIMNLTYKRIALFLRDSFSGSYKVKARSLVSLEFLTYYIICSFSSYDSTTVFPSADCIFKHP